MSATARIVDRRISVAPMKLSVAIVGPIRDWTDNRETDVPEKADRPAHLLCALDGLDGRSRSSFLTQHLAVLESSWHLYGTSILGSPLPLYSWRR